MADQSQPISNVEEYVDQAAQLLQLPIAPEFRPGVVANLERTVAIAQLVLEFSLPPDISAAPTFDP